MKKIFIILCICGIHLNSYTQRLIEYRSSLTGVVSTQEYHPMWATTHQYGIYPDSKGGMLQLGIYSDFHSSHQQKTAFGISGVILNSQQQKKYFIDELYYKINWQKLLLTIGIAHEDKEFSGLSSTNGHILFSTNSRAMPGYQLKTKEIFILKDKFAFTFHLADYMMNDKRYVKNTLAHHKTLYFTYYPSSRLKFTIGLDHWAQWSGTSPILGKNPSTLKDYFRIFFGREGKDGASESDKINVLGNHLGSKYFRVDYRHEHYLLTFYSDMPFEDGSGSRFQNFPDGIYGFFYSSNAPKQWISDIMYEFLYTKKQSGSQHDRPATPEELKQQDPNQPFYGKVILGGRDNYFNNGEYRSGWTFHGRTIGIPFMFPQKSNTYNYALGVYNNRIIAHYIGVKGHLFKHLPYQLRLSYSINYGTYDSPLKENPQQFSFGFETQILHKSSLPLQINLGVYGDYGELYKRNLGFSISLTRKGIIKS